jgi:hypothetical protein
LREQGLLNDKWVRCPTFHHRHSRREFPILKAGLAHRAVRTDDPMLKVGDAAHVETAYAIGVE